MKFDRNCQLSIVSGEKRHKWFCRPDEYHCTSIKNVKGASEDKTYYRYRYQSESNCSTDWWSLGQSCSYQQNRNDIPFNPRLKWTRCAWVSLRTCYRLCSAPHSHSHREQTFHPSSSQSWTYIVTNGPLTTPHGFLGFQWIPWSLLLRGWNPCRHRCLSSVESLPARVLVAQVLNHWPS